jgi:hypothetical protein
MLAAGAIGITVVTIAMISAILAPFFMREYRLWASQRVAAALVGQPLPAVNVALSAADTVTMTTGGHPVMLVAFSTECQFCRASLSSYRQLVEQCAIELRLIARQPYDEMERVWRRYGWAAEGYPGGVVIGSFVAPRDFGIVTGVRETPHQIFVSQDGIVRASRAGEMTLASLRAAVEEMAPDTCR